MKAKAIAARQGVTLSHVVEEAVRDAVIRAKAPLRAAPFKLVTFGSGGLLPGRSWARLKDTIGEEDAERLPNFRVHDASDDT